MANFLSPDDFVNQIRSESITMESSTFDVYKPYFLLMNCEVKQYCLNAWLFSPQYTAYPLTLLQGIEQMLKLTVQCADKIPRDFVLLVAKNACVPDLVYTDNVYEKLCSVVYPLSVRVAQITEDN